MERFGWTYDYLLWGISWINLRIMLDDSARTISVNSDNEEGGETVKRELKTADDIKNYINGLM